VGAGVTLNRGNWQLQIVGDNLFNEKGLSEGSSRTDSLSGQGSSEAIYGRPIFGRNFRLVLGFDW
jgi:outer membrane receptor protein involved in Fe transport